MDTTDPKVKKSFNNSKAIDNLIANADTLKFILSYLLKRVLNVQKLNFYLRGKKKSCKVQGIAMVTNPSPEMCMILNPQIFYK